MAKGTIDGTLKNESGRERIYVLNESHPDWNFKHPQFPASVIKAMGFQPPLNSAEYSLRVRLYEGTRNMGGFASDIEEKGIADMLPVFDGKDYRAIDFSWDCKDGTEAVALLVSRTEGLSYGIGKTCDLIAGSVRYQSRDGGAEQKSSKVEFAAPSSFLEMTLGNEMGGLTPVMLLETIEGHLRLQIPRYFDSSLLR